MKRNGSQRFPNLTNNTTLQLWVLKASNEDKLAL